MKKTILTIVICLISSATFAQAKIESGQAVTMLRLDELNERERLAGLELKKFANHHYIGNALSFGGGVMLVAGYSMIRPGGSNFTGNYLMACGQLLTLAGFIYKIEAPLHIKKAGIILSGNGVGINVKLNMPRKNNGLEMDWDTYSN